MDLSNLNIHMINKSVSKKEICKIEQELGFSLPNIYKVLLQRADGFLTDEGILIYGTQDIIERNKTYEVFEYATGYVAIGDNSGGTVFLMLQGEKSIQLIAVGVGDMNPANGRMLSSDLSEWIIGGCPILE